ncbi:MAG: hypothetical protein AAGB11_03665 [Pseudomonadota bacterium]
MSILTSLWSLMGWRGAAGLAIGVMLAGTAGYHAGRVVVGAAFKERLERRLAEFELRRLERENDRTDAALAARRQAERAPFDDLAGGLPDDGFRRD